MHYRFGLPQSILNVFSPHSGVLSDNSFVMKKTAKLMNDDALVDTFMAYTFHLKEVYICAHF